MKIFIFILFVGFCSSEVEVKREFDCSCLLRLSTGKVLEVSKIDNGTIQLSNKCGYEDFTICEQKCNQTISYQTNGFDLDKPKVGEQNDLSLGQFYCNQIGADVKDAKFMLFVTLQCKTERDIKEDNNGTVVSSGSAISESSITRYIGSGFKQRIRCFDNKYVKIE